MALLIFEGFENREPGGRADMSYNAVGYPVFVEGRSSGTALTSGNTVSSSDSYVRFSHGMPSASTFVLSAAVKPVTLVNETGLMESTNANGVCGAVRLLSTGQLKVKGANSAITATSSYSLTVNEWARIDMVISQENSGGYVQVWVNGVMVVELTGTDTLAATNHTTGGLFSFCTGSDRGNWNKLHIDDIYVTDHVGPAPYNGRLGDVRIESLVPNEGGNMTGDGWTRSTPSYGFDLIDELPSNDTDYLTSVTPGEWETFGLTNLVATYGAVLAVQPHYKAWKTDSGNIFLKPVLYTSLGLDLSQAALGLGTAPVHVLGPMLTAEPGGGAWTIPKINSLMLGMGTVTSA